MLEMIQGLRQGVRELSLFPVLCGSAVSSHGLPDADGQYRGAAAQPHGGQHAQGQHRQTARRRSSSSPPAACPAAFVFKTVSDQYGKYSYIKVVSGTITSDLALVNARTGTTEKLGRLYVMRGKKAEEVKELACGDIGAIGKMEKVKTGDTLCDARKVVKSAAHPLPRALLLRGHRPQDPGAGGQGRRRA